MGEVLNHVLEQVRPAAFYETQHREIRVPIIEFAEPTAGNDIGSWKRQQRGIAWGRRRVARQTIPELVNVLTDGRGLRHDGWRGRTGGQVEMRHDKALQRLRRKWFLRMVERQNFGRRQFWRCVSEFFAVWKDALALDIRVEVLEQHLRRDGLLECERGMRDEKNRRDERHADPRLHAASA